MTTALSTLIGWVRTDIRDPNGHIAALNDAAMINIANGVLTEIRAILQNLESNLVYGEEQIITVADLGEYALENDFEGLLDDGVWIDGESWFLRQTDEAAKAAYDVADTTGQPERYYLTEDNQIGLLWVPDDSYTINVLYWQPLDLLTATTDTIPWYGIWDNCIRQMMTLACKEILERDVTITASRVAIAMGQATQKTLTRGTRQRRRRSNFFTCEGV